MINYMKSEHYRLLHKKDIYLTSITGLLLITATAIVLLLSGKNDANFAYATSQFFYSNVLGTVLPILIIAFLFNSSLTGKDRNLLKQSVSFGISRRTIFWSKLALTVAYFLLICVIGILFMIVLGENLLASNGQAVGNFLIACLNMFPIVLSGFFMIHTLKMLNLRDIYVIIILWLTFIVSGGLLRAAFKPISGLKDLYLYAPSTLLDDNLMAYMDQAASLDYRCWVVGIVISAVTLLLGSKRFAKQNID